MECLLCAGPKAGGSQGDLHPPHQPPPRQDAKSAWTEEEAAKVQRGKALAQGHTAGQQGAGRGGHPLPWALSTLCLSDWQRKK